MVRWSTTATTTAPKSFSTATPPQAVCAAANTALLKGAHASPSLSAGPAIVPWGTEIETGYLSTPQLYHNTDTLQQTNLAPSHPDTVASLAAILAAQRSK